MQRRWNSSVLQSSYTLCWEGENYVWNCTYDAASCPFSLVGMKGIELYWKNIRHSHRFSSHICSRSAKLSDFKTVSFAGPESRVVDISFWVLSQPRKRDSLLSEWQCRCLYVQFQVRISTPVLKPGRYVAGLNSSRDGTFLLIKYFPSTGLICQSSAVEQLKKKMQPNGFFEAYPHTNRWN